MEEKKLSSIHMVVANELGKTQYRNASFGALTCGHRMYYQCGADATAFEQATRAGERPVCHVQHRAYGMHCESQVPGEWVAKWVVNFM